jgi:hypothetical protein
MKARQVATAVHSVYVLDPQHRVHLIERTPDGMWGPWQDLGAEATRIVHAGGVLARIGRDGRVSALQRSAQQPWVDLELEARALAATRQPGGAPALFASDDDQRVWHTWKPTPAAPWIAWEPLAGFAEALAAGAIPGGGLVVFGIQDGAIHHRWQDQPLAPWKEWTPVEALPEPARALEVDALAGGGLVLFAVGRDGGLYHMWQDKSFGRWHSWEQLGTELQMFSATKSPGGGLAVFGLEASGLLRYRRQARPFGEWSPWLDLARTARAVAAQPSYIDGLEVFVIGSDEVVYHRWCDSLDAPWTSWLRLDPEAAPFSV